MDTLLDLFAAKCGCMYLSDIKNINNMEPLTKTIQLIGNSVYSIDQWNDTVSYISGRDISFDSVDDAKQYILSYIKERA